MSVDKTYNKFCVNSGKIITKTRTKIIIKKPHRFSKSSIKYKVSDNKWYFRVILTIYHPIILKSLNTNPEFHLPLAKHSIALHCIPTPEKKPNQNHEHPNYKEKSNVYKTTWIIHIKLFRKNLYKE